MPSPDQRKSAIAFGIGAIALLFIAETVNAHRLSPHPASPLVWGVLGAVAVGAFGCGLWWRWRDRQGRARD